MSPETWTAQLYFQPKRSDNQTQLQANINKNANTNQFTVKEAETILQNEE